MFPVGKLHVFTSQNCFLVMRTTVSDEATCGDFKADYNPLERAFAILTRSSTAPTDGAEQETRGRHREAAQGRGRADASARAGDQ